MKKKSNNNFCQSVKNINPHNNTARLHQYNLNPTLDYMYNPNFQQSCRRSFISETGLGTGHSRGDLKMCLQLFPHRGAKFTYCQAQSQLNSTQPQLKLRLRLALFSADPTTHPATRPPRTVVSKASVGVLLTVSRPLNDHFKTTVRKTMPKLFKD